MKGIIFGEKRWLIGFIIMLLMIPFEPYAGIVLFLLFEGTFAENLKGGETKNRPEIRDFARIAFMALPAFLVTASVVFGKWEHNLYIGSFLLMGGWEWIPALIFAIIVKRFYGSEGNTKKVLNKETIIHVCFLFLPFIALSVYEFQDTQYRFFETSGLVNELMYSFVFAGLFEEIYFRGFLYPAAREKMTKLQAMLFTSMLFMLFHLNLLMKMVNFFDLSVALNLLNVFAVGIIADAIYEKTGRVWVCVLFHAINNSGLFYIAHLAKNCVNGYL